MLKSMKVRTWSKLRPERLVVIMWILPSETGFLGLLSAKTHELPGAPAPWTPPVLGFTASQLQCSRYSSFRYFGELEMWHPPLTSCARHCAHATKAWCHILYHINVRGAYSTPWRYIVHVINSNQGHALYSVTSYKFVLRGTLSHTDSQFLYTGIIIHVQWGGE